MRRLFPFFFVLFVLSAEAQPKRIVSTFPSATETLFALGLGGRVVGVSTYCRYPPEVLSLPKVGGYTNPEAEKIALLRPDLVVIPTTGPGLADRLSALHIRTVQIKFGSLPQIYSMIHEIGAAAGAPDKADALNKGIRARLDTIRAASMDYKPTVLLIIGRTPGLLSNLVAAAPSTYLNELLQLAGGRNALSAGAISYPHISLETVVRLDPDIILDMSMMGESTEPLVREERLRKPWLSHLELKAVRSGNIFGLASEILVTPGPRVVEAVEEIKARIHMESRSKVQR